MFAAIASLLLSRLRSKHLNRTLKASSYFRGSLKHSFTNMLIVMKRFRGRRIKTLILQHIQKQIVNIGRLPKHLQRLNKIGRHKLNCGPSFVQLCRPAIFQHPARIDYLRFVLRVRWTDQVDYSLKVKHHFQKRCVQAKEETELPIYVRLICAGLIKANLCHGTAISQRCRAKCDHGSKKRLPRLSIMDEVFEKLKGFGHIMSLQGDFFVVERVAA